MKRANSLLMVIVMAVVASAGSGSAQTQEARFTLAGAIPDDVFLYIAERHNPERNFLDAYWRDVFEALTQSSVGDDLIGLFGSLAGFDATQAAEVERLRQRAAQLLDGVDWRQLAAKESVFAERFVPPTQLTDGPPPVMMPDMVWLLRGNSDGASRNYEGLVAILEAVAEETNKAAGKTALTVDRSTKFGAKVASMNVLGMVPGAPPLPLSVALRDDVLIIGLHEQLVHDVLDQMQGDARKKSLKESPRLKAAFAMLPPAEDSMVYFDMQTLLKPMREFVGMVIEVAEAPGDVYLHTKMSSKVGELNRRALSAYWHGNAKEALALIREAHEADGDSSIVLYNLACFNALVGEKDEALDWLEKAVEGGFYAPRKIATDPDLESLRSHPRYKQSLAKASQLAIEHGGKDIIINSSKTGEASRLLEQAGEVYGEKNYEVGLKFVEQAYAVAPKDSRVLYDLACFHALLGHDDRALDFLERAVDGGFYAPRHIVKDPDLDSIRGHERFAQALATARKKAAELTAKEKAEEIEAVNRVMSRIMGAVGILDYSATVESTDGYSVTSESVIALVPDAERSPIYSVFGNRPQLTEYDRYLPRETASFSVSTGLDLRELYKFAADSIRTIGPKGEELLAKWDEIQQSLGIDINKDILSWIDGAVVSVTLADDGGFVWLIKVREEKTAREKVSAAIEFLTTKLPENLGRLTAGNPAMAGLAMLNVRTAPVEDERLTGFQNIYFAMSPKPIAVWGVADGHLILGKSPHAVALCLATAKGDHPNVRKSPRVMEEAILPTGPFTSVSLTGQRGTGDEMATLLGSISMGLGMAGGMVKDPEVRPLLAKIAGILGELTPVVRKLDFYKSVAAHKEFDGKTWRCRSVTHYVSPAERAAGISRN